MYNCDFEDKDSNEREQHYTANVVGSDDNDDDG